MNENCSNSLHVEGSNHIRINESLAIGSYDGTAQYVVQDNSTRTPDGYYTCVSLRFFLKPPC